MHFVTFDGSGDCKSKGSGALESHSGPYGLVFS